MSDAEERNLGEYMNRPYFVRIIHDMEEGGFAFCCPELPGCVTCSGTLSDGYSMIEDAKKAWFRSCTENGIGVPPTKYWEGRTPPAEYYQTPDPYSDAPECNINLLELTRYAKSIGKKIVDMTYEEVRKFAVLTQDEKSC